MKPTQASHGPTVEIDRLHCQYYVSRDHPSPEPLRAGMDHIMRTFLMDACRSVLSRALDPHDSSVWIIRKLEFTFAVDPGYAREDQIGSVWGSNLAKAIVGTILRGTDGDIVLRFPDRASYLAAFLRDLVRGRAFDLWQYASFSSLRSLPQGVAAREALLREPEAIYPVLLNMDARNQLEGLLDILAASDILRIVQAAIAESGGSSPGERACAESLLAAWKTAGLKPSGDTYVTPANLVRLLVRTASATGAPWTEQLATVAERLLAFCHIIRRSIRPNHLLKFLVSGDLRSATAEVVAGGDSRYLESLPFLKDLAGGDAQWLARMIDVMVGHVSPGSADDDQVTPYHTFFGGLLLLLPLIAAQEIAELFSRVGVDRGVGALTLLMKCGGGRKALGVFDDVLWRRLTGVSPQFHARELACALPEIHAAAELSQAETEYFSLSLTPFALPPRVDLSWSAVAAALLRRFAARLSGFQNSSSEHLYRNFLDCPASVVVSGSSTEAHLGRPPLAILLEMTGYGDLKFRLPWLNEMEVTVILE